MTIMVFEATGTEGYVRINPGIIFSIDHNDYEVTIEFKTSGSNRKHYFFWVA